MSAAPRFAPIDGGARDGRFQLLGCASRAGYAICRWDGARFVFSSGRPLDFEPTHYRISERAGG